MGCQVMSLQSITFETSVWSTTYYGGKGTVSAHVCRIVNQLKILYTFKNSKIFFISFKKKSSRKIVFENFSISKSNLIHAKVGQGAILVSIRYTPEALSLASLARYDSISLSCMDEEDFITTPYMDEKRAPRFSGGMNRSLPRSFHSSRRGCCLFPHCVAFFPVLLHRSCEGRKSVQGHGSCQDLSRKCSASTHLLGQFLPFCFCFCFSRAHLLCTLLEKKKPHLVANRLLLRRRKNS